MPHQLRRSRLRVAVLLVLAVSLGVFMARAFVDVALHKSFWLDEGFELTQVCDRPAASMLLNGSYSCSPAPLFSMIQRSVVSLEPLGLSMRIRYRTVSLVAATLALVLLLLGLGCRLGLAPALAAFSVLASSGMFQNYAAENRSYMVWLLASVVLILVAGECAVRAGGRTSRAMAALVAAGLLTALAAIPGCLQVAVAFAACLLARRIVGVPPAWGRSTLGALLGAGLAIIALDGYYWTRSVCRDFKDAVHLGFQTAADPWSLLRGALTPFWPEAMSPWGFLAHGALLAGVVAPLVLWRRRASLSPGERHAVALAMIAMGQVLVAIPVTVSLARGGYFVLPRLFIFMMPARAVLIGVGIYLAGELLRRAAPARWGRAVPALVGLCVVLVTAGALVTADAIAKGSRYPSPELGDLDCEGLTGRELRVVQVSTQRLELAPNFLVRLGMALESCGPAKASPRAPRYIEALDVADDVVPWFRLSSEAPAGRESTTLCGRPVVVSAP